MSRSTHRRNVAAPPAGVWNLLGDFDAIARWAPNVDHSCLLTERSDGIGAVRRVQSGTATVVERVVAWEPGSMLAYTIEGLPPIVLTATNSWILRPADGGTSVTLITDLETASGALGLLARRMLGGKLSETAVAMLDGLEHALTQAEEAA